MKFTLRKMLSLLLAVTILCGVLPMGASATVADPAELMSLLGVSRAEVHEKASDGSDVVALAFRFRLTTNGLAYGQQRKTDYTDATVEFNGSTYSLTGMGAVFTNREAVGNNPNALKIGQSSVTTVSGEYLFKTGTGYGEYVTRIVNIPASREDTLIYARPYFVYKNGDEEITAYGDISSANASGKKIRYSVETSSLDWVSGTLDSETGTEQENTAEIRTDFINSTDLLIRLPQTAEGLSAAYARVYYYSVDGYISCSDVIADWTVLGDMHIPAETVAVRIVAYSPDGSAITDPEAFGDEITITANKKLGVVPLTFHSGGLSADEGAETDEEEYDRTGYMAVQDVIVKPDGATFDTYFYDAEMDYLGCTGSFMAKAKKLLDLAPENAAFVRFLLKPNEVITGQDASAVSAGATSFRAFAANGDMYEDYLSEAEEEETEPTEPETTEPEPSETETTEPEPTETEPSETEPTTSTATTSASQTTSTSKTTSTTKTTTTTTKKTVTTTKKTTTTTKAEQLILTDDEPENQGVQNALWNMEQMVNITFTPLKAIPQNLSTWPANVQQKGLPYSSTRIEQAYVPQNVSFHTFMTALQNPNSYIYTMDLSDYGNLNGKTYYGAVCSTACGYALNIEENYTSYQWSIIPGMTLLASQDLQSLKLCDTIAGQGHVLMITGITRDQYGNIVKVKISEAAGSDVHSKTYTITALEEAYPASKYEYCRYSKLSSVTYTASDYVAVGSESAQTVSYNTDIIPRKGDKANWRTSETVYLDVLNKSSYTQVQIYKYSSSSGSWVKYKTVDIASVIKLSGLSAGTYKARLTNGTKNSKWCYWKSVKVVSTAELYQGTRKVKVSFSSSGATPLYIQWMNGHTNATIRITTLTEENIKNGYGIYTPAKGDLKVRVAFKTDYGIIYSELPEIITPQ